MYAMLFLFSSLSDHCNSRIAPWLPWLPFLIPSGLIASPDPIFFHDVNNPSTIFYGALKEMDLKCILNHILVQSWRVYHKRDNVLYTIFCIQLTFISYALYIFLGPVWYSAHDVLIFKHIIPWYLFLKCMIVSSKLFDIFLKAESKSVLLPAQ